MCKDQWPVKNRLLTITLLSIMFFICRAFAFQTQCINPTNALSLGIVFTLRTKNYTFWHNIWVLLLGTITGGLCATGFLDYVYLPLMSRG